MSRTACSVRDGVRLADAGCLHVELLQDLDGQREVALGQDVVGALGFVLLRGSREIA